MLPLPPGSAAAVASLPTGIERTKGESPFSQDPMIGNYHTQVKVTVLYISTLQFPGVVHVGRFRSVFTEYNNNNNIIIKLYLMRDL